MIKMTNGQCIGISNGPMSICNEFVMLSSFFPPIKTKFIQVAACQNVLTPPHFSKWQLSAEVEEGARLRYCVCTGAIALFHVPLFLATSAHPFNWVNRWLDSFCLLQSGVHLPLFCGFCLLHDYECMLPISRWNAVHYNIALCESQKRMYRRNA